MEEPMTNFGPLTSLCNVAPKLKLPALIALIIGVCFTICYCVNQYSDVKRREIEIAPEVWRAAGDYEAKKRSVTSIDTVTRQRVP